MTRPVGILGAGLIGRAWAIVFARAGIDVRLHDAADEALECLRLTIIVVKQFMQPTFGMIQFLEDELGAHDLKSNRKGRRSHLARHDLTDRHVVLAVVLDRPDVDGRLWVVGGIKEGEALDVIPMQVAVKEVDLGDTIEALAQGADAGPRVEDELS